MTFFQFFVIFLFIELFAFDQQLLFRVDICSVTSYLRVQCPRVRLE